MAQTRTPRKPRGYSGGDGVNVDIPAMLAAFGLGDAQANPAFGAEGPGDVDFNYKGDPSKAIKKYGTTDPFVKAGFWGRVAGNNADRLNAEHRLGALQSDATLMRQKALEDYRLKQIPEEVRARGDAERQVREGDLEASFGRTLPAMDAMNYMGEGLSLGAPLVLSPQALGLENARRLHGLMGPEMFQKGLYRTAQELRGLQAQSPRLEQSVQAAQGAEISKNLLGTESNDAIRTFRQANPDLVNSSMRAELMAPGMNLDATYLRNLEAMAEAPWNGRRIIGDAVVGPDMNQLGVLEKSTEFVDPKTLQTVRKPARFSKGVPSGDGAGQFVPNWANGGAPQQRFGGFFNNMPSRHDYAPRYGPEIQDGVAQPLEPLPQDQLPPTQPVVPVKPASLTPSLNPTSGPAVDPLAMFDPITEPVGRLLRRIYNPQGYYYR